MASDKKAEQSYQDWEKPLFDAWKEKGYFGRTPGFGKNGANTYTIVIPPPNCQIVLIPVNSPKAAASTPVGNATA